MRKMALVGGVSLFSLVVAAGCGGAGEPPVAEESDVKETATISFDADFSHDVEGRLVEGGLALVKYDVARMPEECTSSTLNSGQPAWSVTGYYSFNGGDDWKTFLAGGFSPTGGAEKPIIKLEESGTLEVYFHVHDRWGTCGGDEEHYDSNFGENFVFEVEARGDSTTVTVGGGEGGGTSSSVGGGEGGGTSSSVGGGEGGYGTSSSVGGG